MVKAEAGDAQSKLASCNEVSFGLTREGRAIEDHSHHQLLQVHLSLHEHIQWGWEPLRKYKKEKGNQNGTFQKANKGKGPATWPREQKHLLPSLITWAWSLEPTRQKERTIDSCTLMCTHLGTWTRTFNLQAMLHTPYWISDTQYKTDEPWKIIWWFQLARYRKTRLVAWFSSEAPRERKYTRGAQRLGGEDEELLSG